MLGPALLGFALVEPGFSPLGRALTSLRRAQRFVACPIGVFPGANGTCPGSLGHTQRFVTIPVDAVAARGAGVSPCYLGDAL